MGKEAKSIPRMVIKGITIWKPASFFGRGNYESHKVDNVPRDGYSAAGGMLWYALYRGDRARNDMAGLLRLGNPVPV